MGFACDCREWLRSSHASTVTPVPYTGVSVNSNMSIYQPGEIAGLEIVLLDCEGAHVTGACVNLSITTPDGVTHHYSTHDRITEVGGGVYVAAFDHTGLEGPYCVNASAVIEGRMGFFDTYLMMCSEYDFDITQTAEGAIGRLPVNFTEREHRIFRVGHEWDLGHGYVLTVTEADLLGRKARLELTMGGVVLESEVVGEGGVFM